MRDMQTCKFLNLSEVAEMPIGRLVEQTFHEIVEKNLLSEEQVHFLTDQDFCKERLGLYFPLLKEVNETQPLTVQRKINNYDRYYATPVSIGNKKYLICNDLYERSQKPYLEWLSTLENMKDVQASKLFNLSEVAEMPIGRLVEQTLHEIAEKNLLSEEQVKFLTDKDFCKEQLGLYFPLLKEVDETQLLTVQRKINNYDRYYATSVSIGNKKYLICNDLYEKNHKPYLEWLATLK